MAKAPVSRQRSIQRQVKRADEKRPEQDITRPMQAGAREYPVPPFPKQHQAKPGVEANLDPPPMYDAPYYEGSNKLLNKVALITGGDSGIGRAVAILFAREGANVAIAHLETEERDAQRTAEEVRGEGRRCLLIRGDLSRQPACRKAVQKTVDGLGGLDVLVNNAAFQVHASRIEDLTPKHFDETMRTNLYGYFFMSQAAVPHMHRGSAIINSGSQTAFRGSPHLLDYSTTKGGIHTFTRSLAVHLMPRGIRVNAVAPGPVWTPLNPSDKEEESVSEFGAHAPMRRPAQPEEIAPAYVFLASPHCSSYITGEVLPVIGGYE